MNGLRIAIITYNWPPRNAIGTHRPYAWARYWSEAGAQVTVLTAKKSEFDAPLDLHLDELPGVRVIEVPYSKATHHIGGRLLRFSPLRRAAKSLKRWLSRRTPVNLDPRSAWFAAALPYAHKIAKEIDVVISTFGPSMSHQIGHAIKLANPNVRWVADYRDLWSQSHLIEVTSEQRSKMRELEQEIVGGYTDLVTAVSDDMVEKLGKLTQKPVLLVPNGFDIDEGILRNRLSETRRVSKGQVRFAYTGTIYSGKQNPEPLLRALAELREQGRLTPENVKIEFYGARIDVAKDLAKNSDYAPFIRIIGHVPRDEALQAQKEADVLLLLESADPEARGVLTGKVFEYIASGTPIMSLGSLRDYEIPKLLARTGTGVSFESGEIEELKAFVLGLIGGQSPLGFYHPNIDEILRYSRKRQSLELLKELS